LLALLGAHHFLHVSRIRVKEAGILQLYVKHTVNIQGVSGGIVNILGGGSMDYSK